MTSLALVPDRFVLALCIYGEARGEPVEGQIAVASVVRNRLKAKLTHDPQARWKDIVLAPFQFSAFNSDDPNYALILRAADSIMTTLPTPALAQAIWIADGIMSGAAQDNTRGANHYLTASLLASAPPKWAKDQPVLAHIGAHAFLNVA